MIRRVWGILLALGAIWMFVPSATDTKVEVAEVVWEKIPEQGASHETFTMPARTHDIRVNVNEFTYIEAQDLMKVAQAEAGNQGEDGMWLVMSVVLNRRTSDNFPSTIHSVIYQDHQFATVSNGSIDQVEISPEAHLALARVERGEVAPQIIGFETLNSTELDKYFVRAFEHKDHRFYTERSEE